MNKLIIVIILLFFIIGCTTSQPKESILKVSSGVVERISNFQSIYITARNVDVWLPEDYNRNIKYNVLYMHDGQMLYDSTITWNKQEWDVDEVLSTLMKKGTIKETIVVGIWNSNTRHADYFPQKPFEMLPDSYRGYLKTVKRDSNTRLFAAEVQSDNYLKFVVKELKPHIDSIYSTNPKRANTFVMGSSMGGLISMYAICEYPDVFGGAACMSTHWVGTFNDDNNPIPQVFLNYLDKNLPDPKSHKIYFDYGTETIDVFYEPHQIRIDSVMKRNAYDQSNWKTLKFEGANHSEDAWKSRLHIPVTFLLD